MLRLLFFTIIICTSILNANAQESVRLRIEYTNYCDITSISKATYRMTVDVGDTTAIFYNQSQREKDKGLQGITPNSPEYYAKRKELKEKYGSPTPIQCLIGIPSSGNYTMLDKINDAMFQYVAEIPSIEWQISDSTRIICEYTCHQAIGTLYGRTWTVWYAEDIPVSYGPYLLHGLPGMILAASDSEGHFRFEAESIMRPTDNAVITLCRQNDAHKCSREKYHKIRKENDELSCAELLKRITGGGQWVVKDANGRDVSNDNLPQRYYLDKE